MPSQPDPNSPFPDSRLQSMFGPREIGTPSTAGLPTPAVSGPSFPAPPAVATAPPGRPGRGPQPWIPNTTPAPTPLPERQPIPTPPPVPYQPTAPRRDPGRGPGNPVASNPTAPRRDPGREPMGDPSRGRGIVTSLGETSVNPVGEQVTNLSPEGQVQYQNAVVQRRRDFGPLPKALGTIPGLPEHPIVLGKPAFNPFSSRWSR